MFAKNIPNTRLDNESSYSHHEYENFSHPTTIAVQQMSTRPIRKQPTPVGTRVLDALINHVTIPDAFKYIAALSPHFPARYHLPNDTKVVHRSSSYTSRNLLAEREKSPLPHHRLHPPRTFTTRTPLAKSGTRHQRPPLPIPGPITKPG